MFETLKTTLARLAGALTCHAGLHAQIAMLYAAEWAHMLDKEPATLVAFALYLALASRE